MNRPRRSRVGLSANAAAILALSLLLLGTGIVITAAATRTSTTFDEIVMIAGGARGYATGDWSLAPEHPPLVQYLYGILVHAAGPDLPDETGVTAEDRRFMSYRYEYSRRFFWTEGNDSLRMAFLGRLPAVLCALGLILLVFLYGRSIGGNAVGLTAAAITATLPDVLAHGGIAYNDLPLALAFTAAVWAGHAAIRSPTAARGALAGLLVALALGVKNSAVALAPVALVLLAVEAVSRRRDADWRRAVAPMIGACLAAIYLGLVAIYRGDVALTEYRYALGFAFGHVTELGSPAFLLGQTSHDGWWYFFPVALLFKTSAGLHVLLALALIYLGARAVRQPGSILRSPLLAPAVAALAFAALLLAANLNIGFRHALPLMPLLALLTAAGCVGMWRSARRPVRAVMAGALIWPAVHVGMHYPFFISYMSEYGPGTENAHEVLVDSSLDWGHGLLELRRFMMDNDIPSVQLSYFGSALPEGYGIVYEPMPSFFPLAGQPPLTEPPRWIAISATNLAGAYFRGDPFAMFREFQPDHVIARSIYLYYTGD
jgi:hypothetical protein